MNIRPAVDSDSEGVKHVVFSVLREYGLKPDSEGMDKDLSALEEFYHKNNGYFAVVERENKIVATTGIYQLSADTCELRKMYALSSERGQGLGRYLLELSICKAKDLGYKRIVLETASVLREAIALYKKYGFKEYTPDHLSFRCDQTFELYLLKD